MGNLAFRTFLTLCCFLLSLGRAQAESCRSLKDFQTRININLEIPPPLIDHTKTRAEINKNQMAAHEEWITKNGMKEIWKPQNMETAGTAAGAWGLLAGYEMTGKGLDLYNFDVCPYFKKIELSMMYRTIISIPKEFEKDSCAYTVILVHEMKHHKTNAAIVEKSVAKFRGDLPKIALMMENAQPYIDHLDVDNTVKSWKDGIHDAVQVYVEDAIQKEMVRQNSLIDSPEEYTKATKLMHECGVTGPAN